MNKRCMCVCDCVCVLEMASKECFERMGALVYVWVLADPSTKGALIPLLDSIQSGWIWVLPGCAARLSG